ncbi:MAG: SpoIIE family protein phosphatase [Bdellovibrionaceae bacterium]|nr:SpoIIE family protein phosphatase [Pseudobdellovibrionaceae bacterium]
MSADVSELLEKIRDLENQLLEKDGELFSYRKTVSQLNSEIERLILKVSEQLQLAQHIQKFLQPTAIPIIQGIDFSTKFLAGGRYGGNYYDIFEHQDKLKISILLSSASGFSVSSQVLSILIKMSTLREIRRGTANEKIIEMIYSELAPMLADKDGASLFLGTIDKRTYQFTYSRSGSFYAYHQIHGRETLTELAETQPLLTNRFNSAFQSRSVTLNQFDRLVILTQGIVENKSKNGSSWLETSLKESIRKAPKKGVHELRNEILFQNEKFLDGNTMDYDVTVLVAEVKDPVIKLATP